jgi:flagellar basal body-associated protein FliL
MSDDDEDTSADEPKPEKKKSKKPILLILVVVVLVGAAAAAGVFLGPALAGSGPPGPATDSSAGAHGEEEGEEGEEGHGEEAPASVSVDPIVVDVRDAEGVIHHLKVTLAFELKKGTADGDFRPFVPRAREAAIAYLRGESFENLTASDRFEEVRTELAKRVMTAVGEKKAARVLITDFVAQ